MTIAVNQSDRDTGDYKVRVARVTFDASYPTGGEALTAAQLGFEYLAFVVCEPSAGYHFEYDYATAKLKTLWVDTTVDGAVLAEVADEHDMATIVVRVLAVGR